MRAVCLAALAAAGLLVVTGLASAAAPLRTAIAEHFEFAGSDADAELSLERIRAAGATAFRLDLRWHRVAPEKRPAVFDPADPADPAYRWEDFDKRVRMLVEHGLEPIAHLGYPPPWAKGPAVAADVKEFRAFARAAALRFNGRFAGLPRIRLWQVWVEPNVNKFFRPQTENGRLIAPARYRELVNAVSASIHGVRADNVVIAGGLSPFTVSRGDTRTIGPLRFMREMLCMSKGPRPKPTCRQRAQFDVWSHHPYTSGDPTHRAFHPDDVSLGDLPEMRTLLDAAVQARHVVSRSRVRFWVTEFSWDTKPPDPKAVAVRLQARWVAEALYRMWRVGVDLVTWLQLRDEQYPANPVQSGLYYRGSDLRRDRPKPTLTAFRFPFVALPERGRVFVWGRTPTSRAAVLALEQHAGSGWRRVTTMRANRYGIFTGRLALRPVGTLRARMPSGPGNAEGSSSLAFSLKRPPDRFINPFG